jgi:FlaA1/EpsC-like NDP-sugar epimerase
MYTIKTIGNSIIQALLKVQQIRSFSKNLINLPTPRRRLILLLLDILFFVVSIYGALLLRFDGEIPDTSLSVYIKSSASLILFKTTCLYLLGMYRPLLRYSGVELLEIPLKATVISDGIWFIVNTLTAVNPLPRSAQITAAFISIVLIISSRLLLRQLIRKLDALTFRFRKVKAAQSTSLLSTDNPKKKVIIYGAGQAAIALSASLLRDQQYEIIAFVDDELLLAGREVNSIDIYHTSSLDLIIPENNVSLVLLAIPSATAHQRQKIIKMLLKLGVEVLTVPSLEEIISGKISIEQTRRIDVMDLLGREEVLPDPTLLKANITHQGVLVTGAGGSIGSELCRQIAQQSPRVLVFYEMNEFALYSIELELKEKYPDLNCVAYLGSVTDADRLRTVITEHSIDTIYHAAAYKHVPLVEKNPVQGVLNNTYGTLIAAQVANECTVGTFVLISTDKAVRPTNVMGATKRLAELILQSLADQPNVYTRFIMVRFGNVLGSSGSVVPRFRQQIAERKPITITHPDITRYFMSIPEAARLVIQAGSMGNGGEVFLLSMGEPVKIYDLAVQMIELSGLKPNEDIEIKFTGLRPGEKLYEELLIDLDDDVMTTEHPKIYAAKENSRPWRDLERDLTRLFDQANLNEDQLVKVLLKKIVPEYQPQSYSSHSQCSPDMETHILKI